MSRKFSRSCCKLYIPHCNESEEGSILKHHCEQTDIYQYTAGCLFQRTDCFILNAKGDTDLLIVKTPAESAKTVHTIRVGDSTDLQFLYSVGYYADVCSKGLYLKPEPRQKTKTPLLRTSRNHSLSV